MLRWAVGIGWILIWGGQVTDFVDFSHDFSHDFQRKVMDISLFLMIFTSATRQIEEKKQLPLCVNKYSHQ